MGTFQATAVRIPAAGVFLDGDLRIPERAAGLVVFAHGSGSSRFSRRNRQVSEFLEARGFATLLLDLLTQQEDVRTGGSMGGVSVCGFMWSGFARFPGGTRSP